MTTTGRKALNAAELAVALLAQAADDFEIGEFTAARAARETAMVRALLAIAFELHAANAANARKG